MARRIAWRAIQRTSASLPELAIAIMATLAVAISSAVATALTITTPPSPPPSPRALSRAEGCTCCFGLHRVQFLYTN